MDLFRPGRLAQIGRLPLASIISSWLNEACAVTSDSRIPGPSALDAGLEDLGPQQSARLHNAGGRRNRTVLRRIGTGELGCA
jgi:hypothetical protein